MLNIPFEKTILPNGLRLIIHEDHRSPLVAVNLWYQVGSKDEQTGRTGFAHLFEHLMFMGSKHAPYPSFDTIMETYGGHNNGTTSNDRTNYYEMGPSNLLETFLWLEADRLSTLADVITQDELDQQRAVVKNERRQSYENRPYGKAELLVPELMYPSHHPYNWPVIGSHADLEAATVDDVKAFFKRFYRPSNLSLVIAGDVKPEEARALVDRYFGWMPPSTPPERITAAPANLAEDRRVSFTDRVQLPRLRFEWHSPALFADGDADLDLAAQILGGGKSSRLYRQLVFDRRVAQDVWAYQSSLLLGSQFGVGLTAKPEQDVDALERETRVLVERLATDGPTQAELERARNTHLADYYRSLDGLQTRADLLNHYERLLGDPGGVERDIARYHAVTRESLREAFAAVVKAPCLFMLILPAPPGEAGAGADGDGSEDDDEGDADLPGRATATGTRTATGTATRKGMTS